MRIRFLLLTLLIALMPTALFAAGGGKVHGKVVDSDTHEALIGATVTLVGTSRGAVTDQNGEYYILDVQIGTYVVQATYVGYQSVQISNVRVNENLTAEVNFELAKSAVEVAPVEIVAQRPLIEKSATNETRIINGDFLSSLPIRSVTEAAALQPGVVLRQNFVYVRGSRPDETGFTVNGVDVTNVYSGGSGVTIPQDAVEQIQVQTGGYPAEYGGANGGIVSTELRTGGEKMHLSLQAETDNYTGQGKESLGGYSYGYSDYVGTLSGPVVSDKVRFFGSVENTFYRDPGTFGSAASNGINGQIGTGVNGNSPQPRFWNGINFSGLEAAPQYTVAQPDTQIAQALNLYYPAGNRIGGQLDQNSYAATLLFDLGNIQLRTAGSYSSTFSQYSADIHDFLDLQRLPINKYQDGFGNVKLTQFLTPKTYYEVNLNYYRDFYETGLDPQYLTNWTGYGSPASDPTLGPTGSTNLENTPFTIFGPTTGGGLSIWQPGTPLANGIISVPAITSETSIGGRVDFSTETDKNAVKFGGEYTYYTIRHYDPGTPDAVYGVMTGTASLAQKAADLRAGSSNNYGYDVFGNVINSDVVDNGTITDFGPPHPVNAAAYVQDEIQLPDINLNFGLRYDYIDPDSWAFNDPEGVRYNDTLNVISASSLKKTPVSQQISPRLGVSFPVTDVTVFHAQYGKFIQESELIDSYAGMGRMYEILSGGNYYQNPTGFGLMPERTTHYELGFSQQVGNNASFDVTAFYKNIANQVQLRLILPDGLGQNRSYYSLVNGDFSTSEGVEFRVTLRRTDRIQAQLNYTFASAEGTGSSASSSAGSASDQHGYTANIPFPTSFSQENTGSLDIDYRFEKGDG
ncbi:MAG: TonB-dependent receptor, partial [Candidatus Kryptoniota bacterium]